MNSTSGSPSPKRDLSDVKILLLLPDFVTAFATGWPENQPDILVLSLTTHKGVQNFAINKEQALLIAKTIKQTAARLAQPRKS